jgi:hypothetical protein
MRTIILVLLVAVPLTAAADAKQPSAAVLQHLGDICTASGAFGRDFVNGKGIDAMASGDWAPFGKLSFLNNTITAQASFRGMTSSPKGDGIEAGKFLTKLDHAMAANKTFSHREKMQLGMMGNAVVYSSDTKPAVSLELHLDKNLVVAICSSN